MFFDEFSMPFSIRRMNHWVKPVLTDLKARAFPSPVHRIKVILSTTCYAFGINTHSGFLWSLTTSLNPNSALCKK